MRTEVKTLVSVLVLEVELKLSIIRMKTAVKTARNVAKIILETMTFNRNFTYL
jgi:hypothetical protein